MEDNFLDLTDGSRVELKISLGTLYFLKETGAISLMEKIEWREEHKKRVSTEDEFEVAACVVYAVLRSSGQMVTKEEALCLVPMDTEAIKKILNVYKAETERIKKKQQAKQGMKNFTAKK